MRSTIVRSWSPAISLGPLMVYSWSTRPFKIELFRSRLQGAAANVVSNPLTSGWRLARSPSGSGTCDGLWHVQPALFLVFLFPPPTAGALALARRDRARARRASDRHEP